MEKQSNIIDNLKLLNQQEALKKSKQEGKKEKAIEVVKNLLEMKPDIKLEDISKITGLSIEEIKNIVVKSRRKFGTVLSDGVDESGSLSDNDLILKGFAYYMEKCPKFEWYFSDPQEELMKVFRTDAKIAYEEAKRRGEKRGFKKGEKIGKKKKTMEIAKNAIGLGWKNEFISKITGLSVEEIEALR